MFEINGSHITELNDSDLRRLVARLCEAELRRAGLPLSAVIAGGNQDAPDGGLDVRIELPPSTSISGFIPKHVTGFQVKVPDMRRSAILKEMRPRGIVRQVIQELASVSGAYVIVSAKASTADSARGARLAAMRDAVANMPNADALITDFYDRDRLATWVRDHPGMVVWVRERIGQPIRGWRPYASWANSTEGVEAEYLIDGKCRIQDWRTKKDGPSSVENGIKRIREVLCDPKGVVRLVGLSGMGKTRLVQALFDERVGAKALEPALAVYTDLADQPDPSPRDLLRRLVQDRQRAIVVVDNCPPETHQALTKICAEPECGLSLITVEYDIRDEDPEGTEVFRLELASDDIIERLLELQSPRLSQVDRRHITEFSSGNARIALALAHTVRRGESVGNLSNNELFNRLFHQRQPQDEGLLRTAEACSLVYSFNGEALKGEDAELPFLAGLADLSVDQMYRCVSELRERGLIQRRAQWRALLPPALANRLAKQALERMLPERIAAVFQEKSSPRLLKSFSRRLGYLHDCEAAQKIVKIWMFMGGLLSELHKLNDLGLTMLRNIAPVVPEAVLDAIERTVNSENGNDFIDVANRTRHDWTSLLRSIAFDEQFFLRATQLLARFVIVEPKDHNNNSAREKFNNLFQLYLSGTHAPITKRLQIIEELIGSANERGQACGIEALNELLEGEHFGSSSGFEFGARPRDYGWFPKTRDEVIAWYNEAIAYAQRIALSDTPLSDNARSILATKFRGIWTKTGALDALESMARAVAAKSFWSEGWIAVRNTIRFHAEAMPPDHATRLRALEHVLSPNDLLQRARAYVFSEPWSSLDIADGERDDNDGGEAAFMRTAEATKRLGYEVAKNRAVLERLLPDLVSKHKEVNRVWQFGEGLASGADNITDTWRRLISAIAGTDEIKRNIQVLRGFLCSANSRDREATSGFLDSAVDDPVLGPWFPILQTSLDIDERGAARLERSIQLGLAPSWTYSQLWMGQVADSIPASIRCSLIRGISLLPKGYEVAVEILSMWLQSARNSKRPIDKDIALCGRELVRKYVFERTDHNHHGYRLGEIIDACFAGVDAVEDTITLCRQIKVAVKEYRLYPFTNWHLFKSIFSTQPLVALDEFVGEEPVTTRLVINEIDLDGRNPLSVVPTVVLIDWAQVDPPVRFPKLAAAVNPIKKDAGNGPFVWAEVALKILDLAPDRLAVLNEFGSNLQSLAWRGSRVASVSMVENLRALPQTFFKDLDPKVVAWARECDAEMARWAEKERAGERRTDESFE